MSKLNRNLAVAAFMSTLLATTNLVHAQDMNPGGYIGLGYNTTSFQVSDDADEDLDGNGFTLTFGYNFSENFAIEAQLQQTDLDDELVHTRSTYTFNGVLRSDESELLANIESEATLFSVLYKSNTGSSLNYYGRIGFFDFEHEYDDVEVDNLTGIRTTTGKSSHSTDGGMWGAGLDYAVNEGLDIRLDYTGYSDGSTITVGPIFKF